MTPNEEAALVATDLVKSYGDQVALDDVNLSVARGEVVGLVGANGAGKSTFLQLAAGLLEPTAGDILVEGAPAGSLDARVVLSFLADQPALYDDLSVNEHIEYIARLHGLAGRPESADELLELFRLDDRADDLPARFSRGL
ncbi:MAG: ATP-binding cassette domain-containing protein, partial [Acidimicrobiia bacterium]